MKKRIAILFFTSVLLLIILLWIGVSSSIRDLPEILEDARLSVLIESGEHGLMRDSSQAYGFQYELIKIFADSLDVELSVTCSSGKGNDVHRLQKGKADVWVALMPITTCCENTVVCLTPIISTRLMLVQPKADVTSKIRKQYELDGDTIWVRKNSPYIERLNDLAEEIAFEPVIVEMRVSGYEEMVDLVQKGEIKFTICPEYLAEKFKTKYDQVDFSLPLSLKHDLSWCVNAHSPLLQERLNEFLYAFKETNDFQALLKKYDYQVEF